MAVTISPAEDPVGGEWTDTGTIIHPTEVTDDVAIGGATLAASSFFFFVAGPSFYLKEAVAADADQAGFGQLWVKGVSPNELWFTDDAGTDHKLSGLSSLWTDGGTTTFLTSTTDDFAVGGLTLSSCAFGVDVSEGKACIGSTSTNAERLAIGKNPTHTSGAKAAVYVDYRPSPATSAASASFYATQYYVQPQGSQNMNVVAPMFGQCWNYNTGTIADMKIIFFDTVFAGAGTTTSFHLSQLNSNITNPSHTVTNAYGQRIKIDNTGGGTQTNVYGIFLDKLVGTNVWGIYDNAGEQHYLQGKVGVNDSTPTAMVDILTESISTVGLCVDAPSGQTGNLASFKVNGGLQLEVEADGDLKTGDSAGAAVMNEAASGTNPTLIPRRTSLSSGIGANASGNVSIVCAGEERIRADSSDVFFYDSSANAAFKFYTSLAELIIEQASGPQITLNADPTVVKIGSNTSHTVEMQYGGGTSWLYTDKYIRVPKNSSDPSGENGAMHYNTTSNKYRVYENGAWRDM